MQERRPIVITGAAGLAGQNLIPRLKARGLGPLIGKRTWGGLVGIGAIPPLMDGGNVTSPSFGFFSPAGEWDVENRGVAPDVEVDLDPKSVAAGRDPQLERAVAIALTELGKMTLPTPKVPKFPDYHHQN